MYTGAILLVTAEEKLAAVILHAGFEDDEVTAFMLPDNSGAFRGVFITQVQANLSIGKLEFYIIVFTPAFFQGAFDSPYLGFGEVGYIWHDDLLRYFKAVKNILIVAKLLFLQPGNALSLFLKQAKQLIDQNFIVVHPGLSVGLCR